MSTHPEIERLDRELADAQDRYDRLSELLAERTMALAEARALLARAAGYLEDTGPTVDGHRLLRDLRAALLATATPPAAPRTASPRLEQLVAHFAAAPTTVFTGGGTPDGPPAPDRTAPPTLAECCGETFCRDGHTPEDCDRAIGHTGLCGPAQTLVERAAALGLMRDADGTGWSRFGRQLVFSVGFFGEEWSWAPEDWTTRDIMGFASRFATENEALLQAIHELAREVRNGR